MAGTITIAGAAEGLTSGSKIIGPMTIVGAAIVGQVSDVALSSGNNTIAVPATATAMVLVPPASNATALQVDGVYIGPKSPHVRAFDPAHMPASIVVNAASGGVTIEITFI